MGEFFDKIRMLDPIWTAVISITAAMLVGGIIGMERGRQGRAAGMRTHILVCLGATLTSMTGMFVFDLTASSDPLRVAAQVISGIGFLGVGTILVKGRFHITGLTTAAGLWTVAAIGISLGIGYYEGALVTFIAAILTITILHTLDNKMTGRNTKFNMYIEIRGADSVRTFVNNIGEMFTVCDLNVTPPRSGNSDNAGIEVVIINRASPELTPADAAAQLERLDEVVYAIEGL